MSSAVLIRGKWQVPRILPVRVSYPLRAALFDHAVCECGKRAWDGDKCGKYRGTLDSFKTGVWCQNLIGQGWLFGWLFVFASIATSLWLSNGWRGWSWLVTRLVWPWSWCRVSWLWLRLSRLVWCWCWLWLHWCHWCNRLWLVGSGSSGS